MKRLAFRILVAVVTFLFGLGVAQVNLTPPRRATMGSTVDLSVMPSAAAIGEIPVSNLLEKVGDLPAAVGDNARVRVQFVSKEIGWLSIDRVLWGTSDGGKSWDRLFTAPDLGANKESLIGRFQFQNEDAGWMIASFKLYRTADRGMTWSLVPTPVSADLGHGPAAGVSDLAVLEDGRHAWLVVDGYRPQSAGENRYGEYHQQYSSADGKKILASRIYYTEDAGRNWSYRPLSTRTSKVLRIEALDRHHAWASGLSGMFYFQQGRWIPAANDAADPRNFGLVNSLSVSVSAPSEAPDRIFFVDSRVGWLANRNGYLGKTLDGGRTWTDVTRELGGKGIDRGPGPALDGMKVQFSDRYYGWAIDGDGNLVATYDGGVSWQVVDETEPWLDIFLDGHSGWVVSRRGVFRFYIESQCGC
ncbi:MAG: hypothetical protein ABIP75_15145 [Pyrinomonadaceae bacterium]